MKICIMPRWSGAAEDDWYPWITTAVGYRIATAALRPTPDAPVIDACVAELEQTLAGRDPAETVLVGHSVGCQAQLRYLASRPAGAAPFAGLLCVAGWWSVDEPWETIRPWIDEPVDTAAARRAAAKIQVLVSDNDPFTRDHQSNAALWRERLDAEVVVVPGAAHFNRAEEPAVLEALRRLAA